MTLQSADFGKIAITWGGAWTARAIEKLTCVSHANATWISTRDMLASEEPGNCAAWSKATEGVANASGFCETPAETAEKNLNAAGFTRSAGASVSVTFAYANTAASPTLNVGGTGAAAVDLSGIVPGRPYRFQYNGTAWVREAPLATTSAAGIVTLETSTASSATDKAATPSAVKAAKDAADGAQESLNNFKNGNEYVKNATPTVSMSLWWDGLPHFSAGEAQGVLLSSYIQEYTTRRYGPGDAMFAPSGGTWECVVLFVDGNSAGNLATAVQAWSFIGKYAGGASLGTVPANTYAVVLCRRLY